MVKINRCKSRGDECFLWRGMAILKDWSENQKFCKKETSKRRKQGRSEVKETWINKKGAKWGGAIWGFRVIRGRAASCSISRIQVMDEDYQYAFCISQGWRCQRCYPYRGPAWEVRQYQTQTWLVRMGHLISKSRPHRAYQDDACRPRGDLRGLLPSRVRPQVFRKVVGNLDSVHRGLIENAIRIKLNNFSQTS